MPEGEHGINQLIMFSFGMIVFAVPGTAILYFGTGWLGIPERSLPKSTAISSLASLVASAVMAVLWRPNDIQPAVYILLTILSGFIAETLFVRISHTTTMRRAATLVLIAWTVRFAVAAIVVLFIASWMSANMRFDFQFMRDY